ncbi:MAG: prephenate dehydrogenase/arogenate dehydrogenase family protein [Chthoniobacterales bacterium]
MSLGRVAIFGPGLIGGSLALALKAGGSTAQIRVWARRSETLEDLRKLGFEHVSQSIKEIASETDLAIICTPVTHIREMGDELLKALPGTAVVTDAGSTKLAIVEKLGAIFGKRFVGSHPMAGSEHSGLSAARSDLFQNSVCLITPQQDADAEAIRVVEALWKAVGCRITKIGAADHDRLMARISHVPHITASALVNLVCATDASEQNYAGGGYRDTTRVASGSPDLWTEILMDNSHEVSDAIKILIAELEDVLGALKRQDATALHTILKKAKTVRDLYVGNQADYDV